MTDQDVDVGTVLGAILSSVPVGVVVFDREARHIYVSDEFCRQTGLSRSQALGKTSRELWGTPQSEMAFLQQKRIVDEGGRLDWQEYSHEQAGELVYYRWRMEAITGADGERRGAIAFTLNVTEEIESKKKQQEAEQQRELFLGILGHDLRSPLNVLRLSGEALLQQASEPGVLRIADRILRTVERMTRMADQLLELARAKSGQLRLERSAVDISKLCRDMVEEARFAESAIALEAPERVEGYWDSGRLAQLLQNLLANAIDHGKPPIVVKVECDGSRCHVDVCNHNREGAIEPESVPGMFEAYESGANAHHGLGLHIASQIALAHGGRIIVDSSESRTCMRLELPLKN